MHMIGFECIRCGKTISKDDAAFTCPACNSNLQVVYDYEKIKKQLKGTFPDRPNTIFKYASLLPIQDTTYAPTLSIGNTPLIHAQKLGATIGMPHLFIKDDGQNPSASFKDRASAIAITCAREIGARLAAGASTGNAGSSMACMAANTGFPCVIFVPETAPIAKLTQLMIFGARVIAVKGSYDDAFDLCMDVCQRHHWFNRNTGFNPFTREGKKTCSFELYEQFNTNLPDWIAVSSGDGNIISGIWKGLCDLQKIGFIEKIPKLLCAQSENSDAITRTVKKLDFSSEIDWKKVDVEQVRATTIADSISVDIPRDGLAAVRAIIESNGTAITVPDEEILRAMAQMAQTTGIFAEPAAAATWACVKEAVKRKIIAKHEKVACIVTGNGLKDVKSAQKSVQQPQFIEPNLADAENALQDLIKT